MAQRYSNVIRLLFITLVFAPIAPVSSALGVLALGVNYWTDKILLLRRHSRPKHLGEELSRYVVAWLSLAILSYATSNFVVCYYQPSSNRVAPSISFGIAILYWLFPVKYLFRRIPIEDNIELQEHILPSYYNDYEKNAAYFTEDYTRANPVTAHQGWTEWLALVETQLGREHSVQIPRVSIPPRRMTHLEHIHDYALRISTVSPVVLPISRLSTRLLELGLRRSPNPFPIASKEEDTGRALIST